MMHRTYASYAESWPDFLRAHSKPMTRAVHYLGMIAAIALGAGALATRDWRLFIAAFAPPYVFGFASHALIEGNEPVSLRHPVYSVVNAVRMFALWLTGSLRPELAKAELSTDTAL